MSTNISKEKRDDLITKIKAIRTYIASAQQDENTGALLTYISELEKEVKSKKYGLVFEEHRESIDETLDIHTPVLIEEQDLFINHGGQLHFLIEGDNLAALQLLLKTHKGKIKMIYIDPPYNTGNKDFAYDDERIDKTDTFIHSKWLSFMRERLKLARKLLADDGIIFISIDDNEQSHLRLLCDEVFGSDNFFSQVIVQSNKRGQTYKQIAKTHEYIIIYTKSPDAEFNEIEKTEDDNDLNLTDDIGNYNVRELRNRNPKFGRFNRPNLFYHFYVNPACIDKDGFCPVSLVQAEGYSVDVLPYNSTGGESCWRWGTKLSSENIQPNTQQSNLVARAKRDGGYNIYEKYRKSTYKAKSIWFDTDVISERGTVELGELGLSQLFQFPKPLGLLSKCIQIGSNEGDIILDFFAGSGTTGHAVMTANAKSKGYRRFILCTNNENNICRDVTYERIKRVIEREGYSASLKYYKIDFIPISKKMYYEYADDLLRHVRELVELENGVSFTGNAEIAIVLSDEEIDACFENIATFDKCKRLYKGHDVLLTGEQEDILKSRNIEVITIPDYYYKELEG
ncbi:site-specific DNA-methyltransferase [Sporomusa sphaeroides]|uniref:Methyltransferase n=1 Tax=Sporomusa sphaeroides DSM 2875 TaxID=1337886 RepID=A0ABP2C9R8_9FIRM|nr:site-specific DNA-methyltransferase [Sporomusa sphaeroides]OLS54742.1 putative methyltransferase [Sporomusa sphaeroides DSM 2875]CVK20109.1 putative methyltransferase [Sporomusa sphaeroides DSM 2875]